MFRYGLRTIVNYLHCGSRVIYQECNTLASADFLEKEAEVSHFCLHVFSSTASLILVLWNR